MLDHQTSAMTQGKIRVRSSPEVAEYRQNVQLVNLHLVHVPLRSLYAYVSYVTLLGYTYRDDEVLLVFGGDRGVSPIER